MNARKTIALAAVGLIAAAALGYRIVAGRSGNRGDTVQVSGNIEVTDAEVSFRIPGRVIARLVEEGELVKKGQVVALLDDADLKHEVALRRAEYQAAYNALVELEAGARPEELAAAHAAAAKAKALLAELEAGSRPQEIAVAEAALSSAAIEEARLKTEFRRATELYQTGTISAEEYERQKAAYDVATARLREATERLALVREGPRKEQIEQARAAAAQAEAQYELVKAGPRQELIAQAAAKLAQAGAALDLAETKLGYATLVSPMTGIVLSKNIEPGEYVSAGTPVITVGDMVNVWLRAYVMHPDQERVKLGQEVRVRTDTGKVFRGRVAFISPDAEFTPKSVQTPKERTKLVYRIRIDIKNPELELKRGMPADGEILLDSQATQQPGPVHGNHPH